MPARKNQGLVNLMVLGLKHIEKDLLPDYLCELITPYCSARNLRSNDMMLVRSCHPVPRLKTYGEKCFQFARPKK